MAKTQISERQIKPKVDTEGKLEDCFIITPIGAPDSEIRRKTDGLINSVIEPVLSIFGYRAIPAHSMATPGSIPKQILRKIVNDELVIANLTGLNPNVMYELAVRHAVKLPVIILAEEGEILPFDVKDQRTIFYSDTYYGVEECKKALKSAIEDVLREGYEAENPIYDAIGANKIIKDIVPESTDEYLVNRLDDMEAQLSLLIKQESSPKPPVIWAGDMGSIVTRYEIKVYCDDLNSISRIRREVKKSIIELGVKHVIIQYGTVLEITIDNISSDTKDSLLSYAASIEGVKSVQYKNVR